MRPEDGWEFLKSIRDGVHGDTASEFDRFVAFAGHIAHLSSSQNFQDLWALWEAKGASRGYFVEIGAAGGVGMSNTVLLEKNFLWHGIVCEPNPAHAQSIRRNRRARFVDKCVWSMSGEVMPFLVDALPMRSRLAFLPAEVESTGHIINVETISLNDVLTEAESPRCIDFVSIDTEGAELQILGSFDFEMWQFKSVCIEHNHGESEAAMDHLMEAHGYIRKWPELSGHDAWYVLA